MRSYELEPRHPCLRLLGQKVTLRFEIPMFHFVIKIPYWHEVRVHRLLNQFASAYGPGWCMAIIRIGLFPHWRLDRLRCFQWDRVFVASHPETDPIVEDPMRSLYGRPLCGVHPDFAARDQMEDIR